MTDFYSSACALYDGGWRADDREILMIEYDMTEDEADFTCEILAQIEFREIEEEFKR